MKKFIGSLVILMISMVACNKADLQQPKIATATVATGTSLSISNDLVPSTACSMETLDQRAERFGFSVVGYKQISFNDLDSHTGEYKSVGGLFVTCTSKKELPVTAGSLYVDHSAQTYLKYLLAYNGYLYDVWVDAGIGTLRAPLRLKIPNVPGTLGGGWYTDCYVSPHTGTPAINLSGKYFINLNN